MIDLHCHLLPGLDDGAADLSVSIEMARIAHADGIRGIACTPHVKPGIYDNGTAEVATGIRQLREVLASEGIGIELFSGGDLHIAPNLGMRLKGGEIPTLAGSRYFLFEPPHHLVAPRMINLAESLIRQGYVPIVTHPERLTWLSSHYDIFTQLNDAGCLVQITAGSVTGEFGKMARYYSERLMDEGRIDLLATDAHDTRRRPPVLSRARDIIAARMGEDEAAAMVLWRPAAILANRVVEPQAGRGAPEVEMPRMAAGGEGLFQRLFGR